MHSVFLADRRRRRSYTYCTRIGPVQPRCIYLSIICRVCLTYYYILLITNIVIGDGNRLSAFFGRLWFIYRIYIYVLADDDGIIYLRNFKHCTFSFSVYATQTRFAIRPMCIIHRATYKYRLIRNDAINESEN